MNSNTVILERRFIPADAVIFREGEEGNCAYLIQSGEVEIFTENDDVLVQLAKLDPGQIFGEMALIFDEPRTASVKALSDCNLIVISRQTFKEKLANSDATIRAIVLMLTQRMVVSNDTLVNSGAAVSGLEDTVKVIYQNMLSSLSGTRQTAFQDQVLPKLDAFLSALGDFQEGEA